MRPAEFQQKADHACGTACVRMILDHFGMKVPSERTLLKKLRATFKDGIEPWRIAGYLEQRGFQTLSFEEKSYAALKRRYEAGWWPIICWMDWGGHYCVATMVGEHSLSLADPAALWEGRSDGMTYATKERFVSMWRTPGTKKVREVIYVRRCGPILNGQKDRKWQP